MSETFQGKSAEGKKQTDRNVSDKSALRRIMATNTGNSPRAAVALSFLDALGWMRKILVRKRAARGVDFSPVVGCARRGWNQTEI